MESEFAREMQRLGPLVLPPGVTLRPICCLLTNVSGAPAGMALSLLLPPINGFANEGQPTGGVGAAYTVQMGPPFRVLSRPDLAAVRPRVNGFAIQASRAVAVALQRLNALPQSAQWRTRGLRISTNVVAADHEEPPVRWNVYFTAFVTPRNGPEDSLNVFVDASAETVLDTYAGAVHVRVAPK